ncbi:MAG: TorF family putative porin [Pseudomonadota bacterium]
MDRKPGLALRLALACGCLWMPVGNANIDVSGQATLTTDYMFRGVSQTMSGPALQAEILVSHDSGWYGYAWASNVDFADATSPDDGANLEIDVGVGYAFGLTDNLVFDFGANAYLFPDLLPGFDYDYVEWYGSLTVYERLSLTAAYTNNVFGEGTTNRTYEVATNFPFPRDLRVEILVGHSDLSDGYGMSYQYGKVGIGNSAKRFGWQLDYFTTSDNVGSMFRHTNVKDRLVLTLSFDF